MTTEEAVTGGMDEFADLGELSVSTRSQLFAPVRATDMSSAVVHRLRVAISLGLLADGKRLPKEAELAAQLNVTTFALREALAALRDQGLVVTRAGKNGGSFVTYPAESDQLEHDDLLELSSAELRDLGDWRQMLAMHAAGLAAGRASSSNIAVLTSFAAGVGAAGSGPQARRAHGRFHLELASAAQSNRMTRAEFVVHEQIDWLFGLALRTAEERALASRQLAEIADAVREREAARARAGAAGYVRHLMDRLAQLRLTGIATVQPGVVGGTLGDEVASVVAGLERTLGELATEVAPALAAGGQAHAVRGPVSLATLQRFAGFADFVTGVGVIADVDVLLDQRHWIEWWMRTPAGPVANNHHVLDPAREDFYDYESMEYMARPRDSHQPWAYGPYVDYGGVDDYILTVATPVLLDGRFYGVTCADIVVADLERWLSHPLALASEAYLVNAENRVILGNSVNCAVGDVLPTRDGFAERTFPSFGWSLLTRGNT